MNTEISPLRGYSTVPEFYVYVHKKPNGDIFYVGKGKKKRAYSKKNRNPHWANVVNKYGTYDIEIIDSDLIEIQAFELEEFLIELIGIENLTNQTLGGISTTGFRHSEDTKMLQKRLAIEREQTRPDLVAGNHARLKVLHDLIRNDANYREKVSETQKKAWASLPESEKEIRRIKKTEWLKDPEKIKILSNLAKIRQSDPEVKKQNSDRMKSYWENMSQEQYDACRKRSSENINSQETRQKLLDAICERIVVNRQFTFRSKKEFLDLIDSHHAVLSKAVRSANKFKFNFAIIKGYLVEDFDEHLHGNIPLYAGQCIAKLDFDCLPRSKAVVMDESIIFLSMIEASKFCNGKTVDATADFITKKYKAR